MSEHAEIPRTLAAILLLGSVWRAQCDQQIRGILHVVTKFDAEDLAAKHDSPNHDLHFERDHEGIDLKKSLTPNRIAFQKLEWIGPLAKPALVLACEFVKVDDCLGEPALRVITPIVQKPGAAADVRAPS